MGRPAKDYVAKLHQCFGDSNITVAHVVRLCVAMQAQHNITDSVLTAVWTMMSNLLGVVSQEEIPVETWKQCKVLLEKVSDSKLTVFRRCRKECSLTVVTDAKARSRSAGFYAAGHALRREIVIAADIKQQLLASVSNTRFKEKLMHAAIDGSFVIPVMAGTDGVPLVTGRWGNQRTAWFSFLDICTTKHPYEQALGLIIGGPGIPKDYTQFMTPLQVQLLELEEPFIAVDFNQVERKVNVCLLLHTGDGPGNAKVAGVCHASAYDACRLCFVRQEHLWGTRKYFRNDFRAFLPANHELRRDRRFGTPCLEPRPAAKVNAFVRVHGAAMAQINSDKDAKEERVQKHGVKGMHVLHQSSGFDTVRDTTLDVFHEAKNLVEAIINMTKHLKNGRSKLYIPVPEWRKPKLMHRERPAHYAVCVREAKVKFQRKKALIFENNQMSQLLNFTFTKEKLLGILKVLLGWKVVANDIDWLEQTIWEDLAETTLVLPAIARVLWWHYLGHYAQQMRD
eukprot:g72232.t1